MSTKIMIVILSFFLFIPCAFSANDSFDTLFTELMTQKEIFKIGEKIDNLSKELFAALDSIDNSELKEKSTIEELSFVSREIATIALMFSKGIELTQTETNTTDFGNLFKLNDFSRKRLSASYSILQFRGNQINNTSCVYYIDQIKIETKKLQGILEKNSDIFEAFSKKK